MSSSQREAETIAIPRRAIRVAGLIILALLAAVVVVLALSALFSRLSSTDPLASQVDGGTYQAVFLVNGEIYFGRLSVPGGEFCYLRHVYRLTAQPTRKGQQLTHVLVPLTRDIQGPKDELVINRSQILYVENLSPTGKAAQLMNGGP